MRPCILVALVGCVSPVLVAASPGAIPGNAANFTVRLNGEEETNIAHPSGGVGDTRGSGLVTLSIDPAGKRVCYDFRLSGIKDPMMAHIHKGLPLRNGPPVIILFTGTGMSLRNCAKSTRSQLSEILEDPEEFYVSVDTTEFPDGAVRGQLREGGAGARGSDSPL